MARTLAQTSAIPYSVSWIESIEFARQARAACNWDLCHRWMEQALLDVANEPAETQIERHAIVLNNFALLYRSMHDRDQAEACFEQALHACPSAWMQGRLKANWAVLEHRAGDLRQARKLYQQALEHCSDPDDPLALARICLNLSWLHLQQNRKAQAEPLLKRCRQLTLAHPGEQELTSRLHLGQARLALHQKRLTKAEVELLQAIRVAQQMPQFEPLIHARARALLAHVYSMQGEEQSRQSETVRDGAGRLENAELLFAESLTLLEDWGHRLTLEYVDALSLQLDHWIRDQRWPRAVESVRRLQALIAEMSHLDEGFQASAAERGALIERQLADGKTSR